MNRTYTWPPDIIHALAGEAADSETRAVGMRDSERVNAYVRLTSLGGGTGVDFTLETSPDGTNFYARDTETLSAAGTAVLVAADVVADSARVSWARSGGGTPIFEIILVKGT